MRELLIRQWSRIVTADRGSPFERHTGVNNRVHADGDAEIDVGGCRILDRHAGRHQFRNCVVAHNSTDGRELGAAVDASNLVRVRDGDGFDNPALPPEDGHEVGQVILVLGILGRDAAHRVEQTSQREGINTRIDFTDFLLSRRRVLVLNDPCNLLAVADDPAVAARLVKQGGHDRCGGAGFDVTIDQRGERFPLQEWHVARQQHQGASGARQCALGH
jgi:hypothetical protein